MSESFTEVTRKSWGSRLKGAFGGILFGIILIIGSIWLMSWNEGRTIKTKRALNEGAAMVVSIGSQEVLTKNENKLVHLSDMAKTKAILKDELFGVSVNAIQLQRSVEMYQWEEKSESETEKKVGGAEETKTTYSYYKAWSGSLNNSSDFKVAEGHQNPAKFPYDDKSVTATEVSVGSFMLSGKLISSISGLTSYDISKLNVSGIANAKIIGDKIYIGKGSEQNPEIGDVRISFSVVLPKTVSVVAMQSKSTLVPYMASNGKDISMLNIGTLSADEMFARAKKTNKLTGNLLRLLGLVLLIGGFNLIFRPIAVFADVVPFFGKIVRFGTGMLSFLLGLIIGLITIALAWIAYRPMVAIPLLLIALVLIVLSFIRARKKKLAVS